MAPGGILHMSGTIRIFPSLLDAEPLEVYEASGFFGDWLAANAPNYVPGDKQPISVSKGKSDIHPRNWACLVIDTEIDIRVLPQGKTAKKALNWAFPFISMNVYVGKKLLKALTPKMPGTPAYESPAQGQSIGLANVKANQARLGGIIPEIAGNPRCYPDYLLPPHRYFENQRDQWVEMLLCVGAGRFDISANDVFIGDTLLIALGADASYTLYEPGADLSADQAAVWWHSAQEVGNTSTGSAGLKLDATFAVAPNPFASSYTFSEKQIIIPSGAGEFPTGWVSGMIARIEQRLDYEVFDGGGGRDIITGDLEQMAPFSGMSIEIVGDNAGFYEVESYTPSIPDSPGSASYITGNLDPARYDFDVTPATFDVIYNGTTQSVSLVADAVDNSGLVAELNIQLSGLTASDVSGKIRLTEDGPTYAGLPITFSGAYSDVFGSSPVGSTGSATTIASPAEITLSFDDGSPVTGLLTGHRRMAIGYRGLNYKLTAANSSTITIDRLTDTMAVDSGWPGFDLITTVDGSVQLDSSTVEGGWAGPFPACPEGEATEEIEWDILFPGGLINGTSSTGVTVEMQWRDMNGGSWNSQITEKVAATLDQIGFTMKTALPSPCRPEVRLRRIGADSTNTSVADTVQWYGLRSKLQAPSSYDGVTVISVKVKGGGRVASQTENQINLRPTRILPVISGESWGAAVPTREIAPFVGYIAKSIGYTDAQIDMAELARLNGIWIARSEKYDWVQDESTVRDTLNQVLQAGMSVLTIDHGRIKPVRDEPRTELQNMYSPQNMTSPLSRQFSAITPDDADGVDVEYTDHENWTNETVFCRLPGDAGIKTEKININGVTSRSHAWRIGMRRRCEMRYRRWQYKFSTELDALNSSFMSFDAVCDDVPGYGSTALILEISTDEEGAIVTLSEPIEAVDGADHVFAFRRPDGVLDGPYEAERVDDFNIKVFGLSEDEWPEITLSQELPHAVFGTMQRWTHKVLVTAIKPSGSDSVSVEAFNYDERVYQYDDASPE